MTAYMLFGAAFDIFFCNITLHVCGALRLHIILMEVKVLR